jgi:hypothetical protein
VQIHQMIPLEGRRAGANGEASPLIYEADLPDFAVDAGFAALGMEGLYHEGKGLSLQGKPNLAIKF